LKKIPLIIDCDPGVDDAFAIFTANYLEEIDIKAITSVNGNVNIDYTTRNALLLADLLDIDCPVARGESRPIVKPLHQFSDTHGTDGFGGSLSLFTDEVKKKLSNKDAVILIRDILLNSDEKINIAAVGPLTNIAMLFKAYPEVKEKINVLSIMGGAINNGNVTPCSEFNFHVDPEAASIVLNSGVPIILSGLNLTYSATLIEENLKEMKEIGTKISDIGVAMVVDYISKDNAIHDPCAILALTNPEMFESQDMFVQVDTRDGITRGMSYADNRKKCTDKPNCKILTKMDVEKFRKYMVKSLRV